MHASKKYIRNVSLIILIEILANKILITHLMS